MRIDRWAKHAVNRERGMGNVEERYRGRDGELWIEKEEWETYSRTFFMFFQKKGKKFNLTNFFSFFLKIIRLEIFILFLSDLAFFKN